MECCAKVICAKSKEIASIVKGISGFFFNVISMFFAIAMLASVGLTGAYGFYAISAALSLVFVWMMVRETKGIELEEMQG